LNDIAVAHRLLNELDNAARHDTLALIRGWMEHDYAVRVAEFGKAGNALQGKRNFGLNTESPCSIPFAKIGEK